MFLQSRAGTLPSSLGFMAYAELSSMKESDGASACSSKSQQWHVPRGTKIDPHYVICKYMFTVVFQCNFRKVTARFSAGRRKHLLVSDMLLFWCSWFKYRFIKIDFVTVENFALILVVYLVA